MAASVYRTERVSLKTVRQVVEHGQWQMVNRSVQSAVQPGPAVCKQKGAKREQVGDIGKCAPGEITEDDERHDELICREAEQKGRQNDSVQTEEAPKRIEKGSHAAVQGAAADRDVCEQPDERTGRRRNNHRAAEHEHRAVEHAAHDHPARLRRAVGRKLQHERGGQTAQKEG